jgi:hypothetical protein
MMNGVFMRRNTVVLGFGACEHPVFGPKQYKYFPMNSLIVSGHNLVFWHRVHPVCGNTTFVIQREEQIYWPTSAFESALSQSLGLVGEELPVARRLHLIDDVQIDMVQCLGDVKMAFQLTGCEGLNVAEFKRSGRLDAYRALNSSEVFVSDQEARCAFRVAQLQSDRIYCKEPEKVPCVAFGVEHGASWCHVAPRNEPRRD